MGTRKINERFTSDCMRVIATLVSMHEFLCREQILFRGHYSL